MGVEGADRSVLLVFIEFLGLFGTLKRLSSRSSLSSNWR